MHTTNGLVRLQNLMAWVYANEDRERQRFAAASTARDSAGLFDVIAASHADMLTALSELADAGEKDLADHWGGHISELLCRVLRLSDDDWQPPCYVTAEWDDRHLAELREQVEFLEQHPELIPESLRGKILTAAHQLFDERDPPETWREPTEDELRQQANIEAGARSLSRLIVDVLARIGVKPT
jgi:hypothetical protein